jgi:hypothetical protein
MGIDERGAWSIEGPATRERRRHAPGRSSVRPGAGRDELARRIETHHTGHVGHHVGEGAG